MIDFTYFVPNFVKSACAYYNAKVAVFKIHEITLLYISSIGTNNTLTAEMEMSAVFHFRYLLALCFGRKGIQIKKKKKNEPSKFNRKTSYHVN